jgi:CheY-like chemotaxis protein
MDTPRPVWAPRVLVADGYPDAAESMALVLKLWGYQPLAAFDGPDALEIALTRLPDVIFLEICLPRMDGLAVARRIRAEPGMGRTPLLALTGYGRDCDRRASRAAGFDRHLLKPADLDDLHQLLAGLLSAVPQGASRGSADGEPCPEEKNPDAVPLVAAALSPASSDAGEYIVLKREN